MRLFNEILYLNLLFRKTLKKASGVSLRAREESSCGVGGDWSLI